MEGHLILWQYFDQLPPKSKALWEMRRLTHNGTHKNRSYTNYNYLVCALLSEANYDCIIYETWYANIHGHAAYRQDMGKTFKKPCFTSFTINKKMAIIKNTVQYSIQTFSLYICYFRNFLNSINYSSFLFYLCFLMNIFLSVVLSLQKIYQRGSLLSRL